VLRADSSWTPNFHTIKRLSLPCLQELVRCSGNIGYPGNLRDNPVFSPLRDSQDGVLVSLPYRSGSHDSKIPYGNEAFCISSDKPLIVTNEGGRMDLCLVSSQYRLGLEW
jgi:hypothetical protein